MFLVKRLLKVMHNLTKKLTWGEGKLAVGNRKGDR
jgi:hypothetical protein